MEGKDSPGDQQNTKGGVHEGEVILAGVGGVLGGAAEAGTEDEKVVDAAAYPCHGCDVVEPAHDQEEDVVKAHG